MSELMQAKQPRVAALLMLLTLTAGAVGLADDTLFLRLLLGLGLGFALAKGSVGFAGSVNRAYRRGSTQLLQVLMFMFVVTALLNAGLLLNSGPAGYELWVNPINAGLLAGGLMFGFGMSLASCCASGVMVEMVSDLPRALTTLLFFAAGVFLGFPLQASEQWITRSWFSSASFPGQGVYLPDLFSGTLLDGYALALLLTLAFALAVVKLAQRYEAGRKASGTYLGVEGEQLREQLPAAGPGDMWSMRTAALVIALIVAVMMATTGAGWGASTPYGLWFGKLLMGLGVSADSLAQFSQRPEALFTTPLLAHGVSVQNLAIILGTLIATLLMGRFRFSFTLKHAPRQYLLFALGGLLMGLGTRFANGCNVGALFTPIVNFSLSGWFYLVVLIGGGVLGNRFHQRVIN